ncbi:MAG: amidohydrolase [Firmicutes bacterium]|nr:amidohydrolase [Bacillota bacterium]
MFDIFSESLKTVDFVRSVRRELHLHPELTGREWNTVALIHKELTRMGIPFDNVTDGGVLAYIEGEKPGKTVLLRGDCDALPMQEDPLNGGKQPKPCVSCEDGAAHTCGHDVHTACLLGAAEVLNAHKDEIEGRVILMFERGEEGGYRIYYLMKYIQEHGIHIDAAYGMHTDTNIPTGKFGMTPGAQSAGGVNFELELSGKGGHGSRPDLGNSPLDCSLAIANGIKDIRMKYLDPMKPATCNICMVKTGTRRNIVPSFLEFKGTSRYYDPETGERLRYRLQRLFESCAELYECELKYVTFQGPSFPLRNDATVTAAGQRAAKAAIGEDCVVNTEPGMGSDSFSTTCAYYPSLYIRLGCRNEEAGITAGGHNPHHDADEGCLPYGVAVLTACAINYLKEKPDTSYFKPFPGNADEILAFSHRKVPARFDPAE